jgi:hypothetical protein
MTAHDRPPMQILRLTGACAIITAALSLFVPLALRADEAHPREMIFETSTGVEFRATIVSGGAVLTSLADPADHFRLADNCEVDHPRKGKGSWVWGPIRWDVMFPDGEGIGFHRQGPPYQAKACYFEVKEPG